ncbi:hypothetical protein LA080_007790 [Diaporthe eres]|nr:hypothetical protein LA080_007790 [Diaporthe eres]
MWAFDVEVGISEVTGGKEVVDDLAGSEGFVFIPTPSKAVFRPRSPWGQAEFGREWASLLKRLPVKLSGTHMVGGWAFLSKAGNGEPRALAKTARSAFAKTGLRLSGASECPDFSAFRSSRGQRQANGGKPHLRPLSRLELWILVMVLPDGTSPALTGCLLSIRGISQDNEGDSQILLQQR